MAARLPLYKAVTPPSCLTIEVHVCHRLGVGYSTDNWRRMRIKSSGAVTMRLPKPAVPPATAECQEGYGGGCGCVAVASGDAVDAAADCSEVAVESEEDELIVRPNQSIALGFSGAASEECATTRQDNQHRQEEGNHGGG